jgi:hypothetical protein
MWYAAASVALLLLGAAFSASAQAQGTAPVNLTTSRVDMALPPFSALRTCLPFNVLLAAPAPAPAPPTDVTGSVARALIEADYNVINSTTAALEDDTLTLSLAGPFESQSPVNFTIVLAPGSDLRAVSNYGSGLVVIGPGHNATSIRLTASLGDLQVINLTASELFFSGAGCGQARAALTAPLDIGSVIHCVDLCCSALSKHAL